MTVYLVKGLDQDGSYVEDTISISPTTIVDTMRFFVIRILGARLSFRLGISKIRTITAIKAAR